MKISIITVTYNVVDSLRNTLNSIRSQSYSNLELVIVDGGSTDGTLAIAKEFAGENTLIVSEPDQGIYDAMNKGVRLASGKYLNFMNAGDVFYNNQVVGRIAKELKDNQADYIYGHVISLFGGQPKLSFARPPSSMWQNKPYNHQSCFAARKYLLKFPFDLSFKYAADYDQAFRAQLDGAIFHRTEFAVATVNMSEGASKTGFVKVSLERIKINWKYAPQKLRTLYYLSYNIPFLIFIYSLQKLGIFNWVMARVGKLTNP